PDPATGSSLTESACVAPANCEPKLVHLFISIPKPSRGHSAISARAHVYEVRPRKDHRGFDLISDALPFGRLWYTQVSHAMGYAVSVFLRSYRVNQATMRSAKLDSITHCFVRRSLPPGATEHQTGT